MIELPPVRRLVAAGLCATLLGAVPALADDTVRCESYRGHYNYCSARTDNEVRMDRQISRTRCTQYVNWGFDGNGVWVDRGCSAEFRVGRGRSHHGGHNDAAIAVGAVASVAIIAAIAAKKHEADDIESWAVGTFSGYDEREHLAIEMTILPGGSVDGSAGDKPFSGSLSGKKLQAGRHTFSIAREGTGFVATDEHDSTHHVTMVRTGGGY